MLELKIVNDFSNAAITSLSACLSFHNLDVTQISSREIPPSIIFRSDDH